MIKAICFDLDGVYFTPESFINFKSNLPKKVTNPDIVNDVLYRQNMLLFKTGKMTEAGYWDDATKKLGITADFDEICAIMRDSYEVNADVVEYVHKVRRAGYITCICSNNFETRIRELNKKFDFISNFDVSVFSYEVGVMKPDKKIFEVLINRAGVEPNELVYSDDSAEKLGGALELGINAFVYENFDQFKNKLSFLGVGV